MLVLSRKTEEVILIDKNIRIVIVSLGHNRVRIGIEAPPEIRIDREEIVQQIPALRAVHGMEPLAAPA